MCQLQGSQNKGMHMTQIGPREIQPRLPDPALSAANWADTYEIQTSRRFPDIKAVAICMLAKMPPFAEPLLRLRNILVAPFGLKPGDLRGAQPQDTHIGFFPILAEDSGRIVLGLDDWHLDFRIVLEEHASPTGTRYRLTTLVQRHNLFGRTYIALITPFHKLIVKAAMRNAL